jgi:phospholipase/carboxylesterase
MNPTPHAGQRVVHAGAPVGQGRGVVILVHGRGGLPETLIALAEGLGMPDLTFLAPAAANNSWYPLSFLAERAANEPYLSSALDTLEWLVDDLGGRGIPASKIALLGFSQGACLAGEFAVRHATRYGGISMYSGGLIGPPGTTWDSELREPRGPGTFAGTPVFLGCSDVDAHIPKARVDESADVFSRMGAAVTKRIYPGMGHVVNEDEIEAGRAMLAAIG